MKKLCFAIVMLIASISVNAKSLFVPYAPQVYDVTSPLMADGEGKIHAIDDDVVLTNTLKTYERVIVAFWATWCGPWNMIKPYYSELAYNYPRIFFVTSDVDVIDENFSAGLGVRVIPTFLAFYNAQLTMSVYRANESALRNMVEALMEQKDN